MAEPSAPQVLKFPVGLNNRDRESALPEGALVACENLDVSRSGGLITRRGIRSVLSGNFHSFYTPHHQSYAVFVRDGALSRWDGEQVTVLRTVTPSPRMQYAFLNGDIFFTNGYEQGRITREGQLTFWGMATPPQPTCVAIASGGMRAGVVRVTQTAIVDQIESGAPDPVVVNVPEGGGVQVTVPGGASFAVYMTPVDGDQYYQAAVVASGGTVALGTGLPGKRLESLNAVRPIPGQCLATYRGRLWVASDSVVWFTDALSPHWLWAHEGYYLFDSRITWLGPVEDGLFVGTAQRVWFLQGRTPTEMTMRSVSLLGAIEGSGLPEFPMDVLLGQGSFPSQCCAFLDTAGVFCIGRPGGIVRRVTDDHYVGGNAGSAGLAYWEFNGLRRVVAILRESQQDENTALYSLVKTTFVNGVSLN